MRQLRDLSWGQQKILPALAVGLLLAVLGPGVLPATGAGHSDAGSKAASTLRTWVRFHDVVFLSLQTDLKTLSTDDGNGSTAAISTACQQLEADLTTINHVPPIPNTSAERHWKLALSDFRQGAVDCLRGILRDNEGLVTKSGPLLRSGVGQVNEVLAALKRSDT